METIIQNPQWYGLPPPLIPPIHRAVPRRLWTQSYSCFVTREGIIHFRDTTNGNAEFVANISPYLPSSPLETPHRGNPEFQARPDAWYRAQCAFRGLTPNGEVEIVQTLLRKGGYLGMTLELKKVQAEMVRAYVTANKRKAEKDWAQLDNNLNAKAEFWPRRLLVDTFFSSPLPTPLSTAGSPTRRNLKEPVIDVLRIEIQDWPIFQDKFSKAIEGLPIHHEVVRMPYHRGGEHRLVVGVNKDDVTRESSMKQEAVGDAQAEVAGRKEGTKLSLGTQGNLASPPSTWR